MRLIGVWLLQGAIRDDLKEIIEKGGLWLPIDAQPNEVVATPSRDELIHLAQFADEADALLATLEARDDIPEDEVPVEDIIYSPEFNEFLTMMWQYLYDQNDIDALVAISRLQRQLQIEREGGEEILADAAE